MYLTAQLILNHFACDNRQGNKEKGSEYCYKERKEKIQQMKKQAFVFVSF